MNKAEKDGKITGMRLAKKCPPIQHLLFADDSLFLCRSTLKECNEFLRCLKLYGKASGQVINFQKSAITFGEKIDPIMRQVMANLLGIKKEGGTGTYLGLLECFSGSKQKLLAFIGEKLDKRLKGWYAKTLSLGEKEVLLKSIAMGLPVYAMSCFRLTQHHCQKITSAMSRFWWNSYEKKKKIHWIAWKELCKSKENGGLGFRDLSDFNQALLAKQAWKLHNESDSLLARVYKGRYYATRDFLECGKGYRPSYAWRSIIHGRELLECGMIKSIGDGTKTKVWLEKWIMDLHPRGAIHKQMSTYNGSYTIKSGYCLLANHPIIPPLPSSPTDTQWRELKRKVWTIQTVPKIKMFMWRVLSEALAVADRLTSRGFVGDTTCKLCGKDTETINHVLFQCDIASHIWEVAGNPIPDNDFGDSLEGHMEFFFNLISSKEEAVRNAELIPWMLWINHRNAILMAGIQESVNVLVQRGLEEAKAWREVHNHSEEEQRILSNHDIERRWLKPAMNVVKCNVHGNWRNSQLHSGGAWIARDHNGSVMFHSREAFTCTQNRIIAEFRVLIWAMRGLRDLHVLDVEFASDCSAVISALSKPGDWLRYRVYTEHIYQLRDGFRNCSFELEMTMANLIAREISRSVLRDGRFSSYIARGGPAWLHNLINREAC